MIDWEQIMVRWRAPSAMGIAHSMVAHTHKTMQEVFSVSVFANLEYSSVHLRHQNNHHHHHTAIRWIYIAHHCSWTHHKLQKEERVWKLLKYFIDWFEPWFWLSEPNFSWNYIYPSTQIQNFLVVKPLPTIITLLLLLEWMWHEIINVRENNIMLTSMAFIAFMTTHDS